MHVESDARCNYSVLTCDEIDWSLTGTHQFWRAGRDAASCPFPTLESVWFSSQLSICRLAGFDMPPPISLRLIQPATEFENVYPPPISSGQVRPAAEYQYVYTDAQQKLTHLHTAQFELRMHAATRVVKEPKGYWGNRIAHSSKQQHTQEIPCAESHDPKHICVCLCRIHAFPLCCAACHSMSLPCAGLAAGFVRPRLKTAKQRSWTGVYPT